MQKRKFKVNDKVKIISTAFGLQGEVGTVEIVDAIYGSNYCRVSANTEVCYTSQEIDIGRFGTNSWRYGFYEHELELVEEKPKFKVGDLVVHPSLGRGVVKKTEALDCNKYKVNVLFGRDNEWVLMDWDIKHYNIDDHIEDLLSKEPSYAIGQEVYVAAGVTRDLKRATIIDAVPREGLLKVNVGGFDCFVEEERVYTREETKGK